MRRPRTCSGSWRQGLLDLDADRLSQRTALPRPVPQEAQHERPLLTRQPYGVATRLLASTRANLRVVAHGRWLPFIARSSPNSRPEAFISAATNAHQFTVQT